MCVCVLSTGKCSCCCTRLAVQSAPGSASTSAVSSLYKLACVCVCVCVCVCACVCSRYPCENILIHEFAHTVMTLGMSEEQHKRVKDSYDRAVQANKYAKGKASEALLHSTLRMVRGADYTASPCRSQ